MCEIVIKCFVDFLDVVRPGFVNLTQLVCCIEVLQYSTRSAFFKVGKCTVFYIVACVLDLLSPVEGANLLGLRLHSNILYEGNIGNRNLTSKL